MHRSKIAAAVVAVAGFGLVGMATPAQATQHYIAFVNYYSDASLSTLVGSWTFNDCYGEQGSWGWGAQTSFHTIDSEPCP